MPIDLLFAIWMGYVSLLLLWCITGNDPPHMDRDE